MESVQILSAISFVCCLFACIDIAGKKESNKFKVNALYSIANICNIVYFILKMDWVYFGINLMFLTTSLIGIKNNINMKKVNEKND